MVTSAIILGWQRLRCNRTSEVPSHSHIRLQSCRCFGLLVFHLLFAPSQSVHLKSSLCKPLDCWNLLGITRCNLAARRLPQTPFSDALLLDITQHYQVGSTLNSPQEEGIVSSLSHTAPAIAEPLAGSMSYLFSQSCVIDDIAHIFSLPNSSLRPLKISLNVSSSLNAIRKVPSS